MSRLEPESNAILDVLSVMAQVILNEMLVQLITICSQIAMNAKKMNVQMDMAEMTRTTCVKNVLLDAQIDTGIIQASDTAEIQTISCNPKALGA